MRSAGRLYSSLASATITGVAAAAIGVPPRQKCDTTMAAVTDARLATMSVWGDSLLPPPPLGARPFDTERR